ncbi:MAG: AAA family ATPase, partial [Armatimonadota bacterium]|nr:AAA family ATPase [Armatimonadota bacterium]
MILLHRLQAWNFKQLTDLSLTFPREGAILIEGSNEAGKSSLFEAVFFALYGQPLIGDRDYRLEELRTYGADEMRVELEFSIEDRPFTITRRVGQKQTAKLLCAPGEDGERESISIVNEVRRRLEEELRLSPAALLNTCFVEQKKLERLENLGAPARRDTINELLNLRVLTALESEFKISRDDEAALRLLQSRVEIAELDDRLPGLQEDEQTARRGWLTAQLLDLQTEGAALQTEINAADARLAEIASRRNEITGSLQAAAALRERLVALRSNLLLRARRWEEAAASYDRACHDLQAPERRAATLPERQRQYEEWIDLASRLQTLERLDRIEEQEAAIRTRLEVIRATQHRQDRLGAQTAELTLRLGEGQQAEKDAADALQSALQRAA